MSVGIVDKQTGDRIPTAGMPAIDNALSAISANPVQNAIITAALANKQDKTDNNLQTTDKTVVGAINEHEGDIRSLMSGLTNLDVALSVPEGTGKNLWTNDVYKYNTGLNSSGNEYSIDAYNLYKISVKENTNYVLSLTDTESVSSSYFYRVQFLDASDNSLGLVSGNYGNVRPNKPFTTPSGTVQVKVSVRKLSSDIQLELGSTATAYTPYIPSVDARLDAVESGLTSMVLLASGSSASIAVSGTNVLRKYKEFFFLIEGTIEGSQNTIITSCIVPKLAIKTDSWNNRAVVFGDVLLYLEISPGSVSNNGFIAAINKTQSTDWNYIIKEVYGFN